MPDGRGRLSKHTRPPRREEVITLATAARFLGSPESAPLSVTATDWAVDVVVAVHRNIGEIVRSEPTSAGAPFAQSSALGRPAVAG